MPYYSTSSNPELFNDGNLIYSIVYASSIFLAVGYFNSPILGNALVSITQLEPVVEGLTSGSLFYVTIKRGNERKSSFVNAGGLDDAFNTYRNYINPEQIWDSVSGIYYGNIINV